MVVPLGIVCSLNNQPHIHLNKTWVYIGVPSRPSKGSNRRGRVEQLGAHHPKFATNCPCRIAPAEVKGTFDWIPHSCTCFDLDEEGVYNNGMQIYLYTYVCIDTNH